MRPVLTLIFLSLSSCMANDGLGSLATSERNIYKLSRISLGMSEEEVFQIMKHPYNQETFEIGEDLYDVWFYVTRPTVLGQSRMVPMNLTPLTFRNGTLVGCGYVYYNYLVRETREPQAVLQPIPEKKEVEDIQLEKSLNPAKPGQQVPAQEMQSGEELLVMSRPAPQPPSEAEEQPPEEKRMLPPTEKDEQMLDEESEQNFDFW